MESWDEIIRNPSWTFIGVIITFVGIVIAVIIAKTQNKYMKLSYMIKHNESLVNINKNHESDINILFRDKEVKNVQLVVIKFINNGKLPITTENYDKPLTIKFNENSEIMSFDIIEKNPKEIDVIYSIEKNEVEFEPFLLNRHDNFSIKALIADYNDEIHVTARIIGLSTITEIKKISIEDIEEIEELLFPINIRMIFFRLIKYYFKR